MDLRVSLRGHLCKVTKIHGVTRTNSRGKLKHGRTPTLNLPRYPSPPTFISLFQTSQPFRSITPKRKPNQPLHPFFTAYPLHILVILLTTSASICSSILFTFSTIYYFSGKLYCTFHDKTPLKIPFLKNITFNITLRKDIKINNK